MSTYTARAYREGTSWVIEVTDVGVTQAATLDKVEHMARDLVAIVQDVDYDSVDVTVDYELPDGLSLELARAKKAGREAAQMQEEAADAMRRVVTDLRLRGLTVREIGAAAKLSPARIAQLMADVAKTSSRQAGASRKQQAAAPRKTATRKVAAKTPRRLPR